MATVVVARGFVDFIFSSFGSGGLGGGGVDDSIEVGAIWLLSSAGIVIGLLAVCVFLNEKNR